MDEKVDAANKLEQSSNSDIAPDSPDLEHDNIEHHKHVISGDPEPPFTTFSRNTRIFIVFMVAACAMISPFAASSYYPALNTLAKELHVSNSLINLTVTTYMICQAISPAVTASISDTGGRRLSFVICLSIFLVANIGLALQTNYAALLILRMVQSSGSSGTIALAIAVVADISTSAQRGKYSGYATCGLLFGPSLGPIVGGILAEYLGWRWIFWFLAILSGTFLFLLTFFFPETCRNVVGNGSIPARGINLSVLGYIQQRRSGLRSPKREDLGRKRRWKWSIPNQLLILRILKEKESALLLAFLGLSFSGQMYINAALPSMLASTYHYNDLQVGLCFVPLGIGALSASIWVGYIMDWNFRRHAKRVGMVISKNKQQNLSDFPLERARIEVILPNHILALISIIAFGWAMHFQANIAGPEILLFCVGTFITAAFNVSNALLIDLHRESPATATAATNLARCLFSAVGVAIIIPMINAMGRGWAFTVLGCVYIIFTPVLWLLIKWGPEWREKKHRKTDNNTHVVGETP